MIGLTILGSTGSIGESTLDVISRHRETYRIVALTAGKNVAKLVEQCRTWKPRFAVIADEAYAGELADALNAAALDTEVLAGMAGLEQVAAHKDTDYVMAAIVGAAGLLPTLAAARAGKRVLLANKEALVMSGQLFIDAITESGAELLPIDSEHNAIFQCMPVDFRSGLERTGVKRILLTASGGPFRTTPLEDLADMTPEQACAHPNWDMGRKISVDSATMMNKGLELIEACWLFNTTVDKVEIVLHPQSVIHSMVEYIDGSVLAQLGNPDMRTPIAHALAWPERMSSGVPVLDMFKVARLDFSPPDTARFPCLRLAREAAGQGGTASAILNAANEVAVQAFLDKRIRFTGIARIVEETLANVTAHTPDSLEVILSDDAAARDFAFTAIQRNAA